MLRTALKCLLALTLVLQGAVGAIASSRHHCDQDAKAGVTQHPSPHQPCCPQQVCVANCDMCGVAFIAPMLPIVVVAVPQAIERNELRVPEHSRTDSPPIRPPIA